MFADLDWTRHLPPFTLKTHKSKPRKHGHAVKCARTHAQNHKRALSMSFHTPHAHTYTDAHTQAHKTVLHKKIQQQ